MNIEQFRTEQIEPLRQASFSRPHPNFFIVGGMRCGTTSLWAYLRQHPQIYMPQHKEPIFFCLSHSSRANIRDVKTYLNLFSGVTTEKAIGEASAAYLTSPESAELIHATYPDAKIIISLRSPVEQTFSVYQWMIREGWEWIAPFEKALLAEQERWHDEQFKNDSDYYYVYFYSRFALYSEQIDRYFQLFPRRQVKIILFDDLKKKPIQTVQDLYAFLEVDPHFVPQIEIQNKAQIPFWVRGHYFFKKRMPALLKRYHIPKPIRKWLTQQAIAMNLSLGRFRDCTLHPATRRELLHRYQNDIRKTSQLIERNLDMWLKEDV